ncbi:hypothetical protein DXF93_09235 [Escherichia coli]|nr:hypothetical protein C2U51_21825 [Enterobacteriaceae bacterium ENNIH1]RDT55159.1 hypothetical protein DXF93_09235 [Escherichia coli]
MPVILRTAAVLAALVRPSDIVNLCSWGFTSLPPCCNSDYLGYGITLARKHDKMRTSWPKLKE